VRQLEKDLPELLNFLQAPKAVWKKVRTTSVIERCFVEVRRRTQPTVTFVNIKSMDRIIFAIFNRFNQDWKNHTLKFLNTQLDITPINRLLLSCRDEVRLAPLVETKKEVLDLRYV